MKIIFLDIDGVMNSGDFYTKRHEEYHVGKETGYSREYLLMDEVEREIDPQKVVLLNEIIEKTGAKIVLSSSWRLLRSEEECISLIPEMGVIGECLGKTPRINTAGLYRGNEIQAWMDECDVDIEKFIILDDDRDMAHLLTNLVHTNWKTGLTKELVDQAILRLNE